MNAKHCPNCNTRMVKGPRWWQCPDCGATAPLRKTPTIAPDTSLRLGDDRRAWLVKRYGSIQKGIKVLIDYQMWFEDYDARDAALSDDMHPAE